LQHEFQEEVNNEIEDKEVDEETERELLKENESHNSDESSSSESDSETKTETEKNQQPHFAITNDMLRQALLTLFTSNNTSMILPSALSTEEQRLLARCLLALWIERTNIWRVHC